MTNNIDNQGETPVIVRNGKGKFAKGTVANPKGRPKKVDILAVAEDDRLPPEFFDGIKKCKTSEEKIDFCLDYLVTNVKSETALFRFLKEFTNYFKATRKAEERKVVEDKNITISFLGFGNKEDINNKLPKDITPKAFIEDVTE